MIRRDPPPDEPDRFPPFWDCVTFPKCKETLEIEDEDEGELWG